MYNPRLLCMSCALTTERPNDANTVGLAEFARAEAAKRRRPDWQRERGRFRVPFEVAPEVGQENGGASVMITDQPIRRFSIHCCSNSLGVR